MRRTVNRHLTIISLVGLIFLVSCTALQAQALKFPNPEGPVNDYAQVISPRYEAQMRQLAQALWDQTGTSVVVATFHDLGGESPQIFANKLYKSWRIGAKGEDKGVLFLVAKKEKIVTFETGYGVKGILPDAKMGEVLDQLVIPFLRTDKYDEGLFNGMKAVAQIVAQDAKTHSKAKKGVPLLWYLVIAFIILVILCIIFGFVYVRRSKPGSP